MKKHKKDKNNMHRHRRIALLVSIVFLLIVAATAAFWYVSVGDERDQLAYKSFTKNIAYCGTKHPEQTLNLYLPQLPEENIPVVAYIHGGGWRAGYKDNPLIQHYRSVFLEHGIAVAEIGYRLKPAHPYPDQNNDIACALQYLADSREKYGLAADRTLLFGDSAGGQLAAAAALSGDTDILKYHYPRVRGVIDFYGVSDFRPIISSNKPDKNALFYVGKLYDKSENAASPVAMVAANAPPFLIVHGDKDRIVPIAQSELLHKKMQEFGNTSTLLVIKDARHGFIGPELPDEWRSRLETAVDAFLAQALQV